MIQRITDFKSYVPYPRSTSLSRSHRSLQIVQVFPILQATPTALKGYRREITLKEISVTSRINKDEKKDALKNTTQNEQEVVRNGTVSSKVQVREKVPQNQQGEEFAADKQEDVAVESVNEGTQESRKTEQSQNDYCK